MRRIATAIISAIAALTAAAMPPLPAIPSKRVSITEYGGIGNGTTDNTVAFRTAIAKLAACGGGHLDVPEGIWLTGPIELESHIDLHVAEGGIILFTPDRSQYPLVRWDIPGNPDFECASPISARHKSNISITGRGVIDGNGHAWRPVKRAKLTDTQWKHLCTEGVTDADGKTWYPNDSIRRVYTVRDNLGSLFTPGCDNDSVWASIHDFMRPVMVSIADCDTVLLDGVTFANSPRWNIRPQLCRNLTVRGISVRNPHWAQNGDGIDIESCADVYVADCTFDVGDDAICLKSGRDLEGLRRGVPTERVLIERCKVYSGHGGFVVGSEMSGGVRNVDVRQCTFIGTDAGIKFKSTRGRGGEVRDIRIDSIAMLGILGDAITIDLYYARKGQHDETAAVDDGTPVFRDITITNVTCSGARRAIHVNGLPEMPVAGLILRDIHITADSPGSITNAYDTELTHVTPIPDQK